MTQICKGRCWTWVDWP